MPNALRLIHMPPDFDAPGNNDDFTFCWDYPAPCLEINPKYIGMPEAWKRVAPYLHVYLMQNGGYAMSNDTVPTDQFKRDFCGLFNPAGGRESIASRFDHGVGGWPTFSAWPGHGMRLSAGEFAAYVSYWRNAPEATARALGDLAMSCGASAGYLDGGTVSVGGDVPPPWVRK